MSTRIGVGRHKKFEMSKLIDISQYSRGQPLPPIFHGGSAASADLADYGDSFKGALFRGDGIKDICLDRSRAARAWERQICLSGQRKGLGPVIPAPITATSALSFPSKAGASNTGVALA
ncbi:hypothetical protein [Methylosinus sp. RM1]|uniref:hypothetical protein n=1 Tax=Methylosinus sp. RM1 TaxID=2583817 RepID=UPI001409EA83|nr:hypothetical protein [Methylosinus sp. RM1]